mgnify:FL=1
MKTMMKRILAFALAALLILGMTVTGAAADPALNQKLKINQVAAGDTVKAYRLVEYDAAFNGYTFYASFATFLEAEKDAAGFNSLSVQEYFTEKIGTTGVAELLGKYAAACAKDPATYTLPAVTDEQVAAADETVTFDALEPGYYLMLVTTLPTNSKIYKPVSVFVRVVNEGGKNVVSVYAAGSKLPVPANPDDPYEIEVKSAAAPSIIKEVADDSGVGAVWKTSAGANVGDTVNFSIKLEIPAYKGVSGMTLKLTDELHGLIYNAGSAKVYKSRPGAADSFANEVAGALTETVGAYDPVLSKQTVEFTLDYATLNTDPNLPIEVYISYSAVLAKEVARDSTTVPGTTDKTYNKAANRAVLTYTTSNEPETEKTTDAQTASVYTYSFFLDKRADETVDGTAATELKTLKGAKFTLYKDDAFTQSIEFVKDGDYYRPATADDDAATKVTALEADNTLLVKGLDRGIYYIEETTTPAGYYAPNKGFKIELNGERDVVDNALTGKLLDTSSFTETDAADRLLIAGTEMDTTALNQLNVTLKNSSTPILPTTGGMGTALFTVGGVALMAVAAWLFFRRKEKKD